LFPEKFAASLQQIIHQATAAPLQRLVHQEVTASLQQIKNHAVAASLQQIIHPGGHSITVTKQLTSGCRLAATIRSLLDRTLF